MILHVVVFQQKKSELLGMAGTRPLGSSLVVWLVVLGSGPSLATLAVQTQQQQIDPNYPYGPPAIGEYIVTCIRV